MATTRRVSLEPAQQDHVSEYSPPELVEIGSLRELTLGCDKRYGDADGFTFIGQSIVCSSA
jgi:hypothetical protein